MSFKEKEVIRLNLVYLTYNFLSNSILIEYYVDDEEYPDVEVSFTEVTNILDMWLYKDSKHLKGHLSVLTNG